MKSVRSALPEAIRFRCDRFFEKARADGKAVALLVDQQLPEYDRYAGWLGMYHYTQLFCELGFAVVFIPHNRKPIEPYSSALRHRGIEVCDSPFNFSDWIALYGKSVQVAWLSRPLVAKGYLSPIRAMSSAKVLYCGRDLHFLRRMRQSTIENDPQAYANALEVEAVERSLISSADATLVFSSVERQVIAERFGIRDKVRVVPAYVYDRIGPGPVDPPLSERRNVLFVGGFRHPPNIDAVNWFAKEVWPAVARAFPDGRFAIVGSDSDRLGTPAGDRIDVLGHAPDLDPCFARARLSVAPVRYGAGVKGKIVSSLARGVPVVTTSVGAEGMGLTDGANVLIADEPEAFAERIGVLWRDADLWRRLSDGGELFVAQNYGRDRARGILAGILLTLGVVSRVKR